MVLYSRVYNITQHYNSRQFYQLPGPACYLLMKHHHATDYWSIPLAMPAQPAQVNTATSTIKYLLSVTSERTSHLFCWKCIRRWLTVAMTSAGPLAAAVSKPTPSLACGRLEKCACIVADKSLEPIISNRWVGADVRIKVYDLILTPMIGGHSGKSVGRNYRFEEGLPYRKLLEIYSPPLSGILKTAKYVIISFIFEGVAPNIESHESGNATSLPVRPKSSCECLESVAHFHKWPR